jgi:hypothetical protein
VEENRVSVTGSSRDSRALDSKTSSNSWTQKDGGNLDSKPIRYRWIPKERPVNWGPSDNNVVNNRSGLNSWTFRNSLALLDSQRIFNTEKLSNSQLLESKASLYSGVITNSHELGSQPSINSEKLSTSNNEALGSPKTSNTWKPRNSPAKNSQASSNAWIPRDIRAVNGQSSQWSFSDSQALDSLTSPGSLALSLTTRNSSPSQRQFFPSNLKGQKAEFWTNMAGTLTGQNKLAGSDSFASDGTTLAQLSWDQIDSKNNSEANLEDFSRHFYNTSSTVQVHMEDYFIVAVILEKRSVL